MHVTQPDAAAMQLVRDEFKALWAQVASEIDKAFQRADPSRHSAIEAVKQTALSLKCSIEQIHIARTAPIEGGDRMGWRSQHFASSQTQADLLEHYRKQQEGSDEENPFLHQTYYTETEPWRETSAWYLTKHVIRLLFRARFAHEKLLKDSALSALFSVHKRPHETVRFGGVWGNPSWVRLLKDLAIDQCYRLAGNRFYEDVVITADDYDAINAAFDEVPELNYAAKLAGTDAENVPASLQSVELHDSDGIAFPDFYPDGSDTETLHVFTVRLREFSRTALSLFTGRRDDDRGECLRELSALHRDIQSRIDTGIERLLSPDIDNPAAWLVSVTEAVATIQSDATRGRRPDDVVDRIKAIDRAVDQLGVIERLQKTRRSLVPEVQDRELRPIDLEALRDDWRAFLDCGDLLAGSVERLFQAGMEVAGTEKRSDSLVLEVLAQRCAPRVCECWQPVFDAFDRMRQALETVRARLRFGHVEYINAKPEVRDRLRRRWNEVQQCWRNNFADDRMRGDAQSLLHWCNGIRPYLRRTLLSADEAAESPIKRNALSPPQWTLSVSPEELTRLENHPYAKHLAKQMQESSLDSTPEWQQLKHFLHFYVGTAHEVPVWTKWIEIRSCTESERATLKRQAEEEGLTWDNVFPRQRLKILRAFVAVNGIESPPDESDSFQSDGVPLGIPETGQPPTDFDDKLDSVRQLPERIQLAYGQWLYAKQELTTEDGGQPEDREAYSFLQEERPEHLGDLKPFDTWTRYIRMARKTLGTNKHHARAGRSGRSVIPSDET
ncbi:hypothetical protein GC176_22630 [bacterium]|nr:hypothetical protein [bacterium]